MSGHPYHHGNLSAALLDTGLQVVREGGPAALTAREVTQRVGVSTAALYRHYADIDQLRAEVARLARERLAGAMLDAMERLPRTRSPRSGALQRFESTGRAYVEFALAEPRLFQCAFAAAGPAPLTPDDPSAWDVLGTALDDLLAAGALDPGRRAEAPFIAWTSVHGLASLAAVGGLPDGVDAAALVDTVLAGINRALGLPRGR